MSASIMAAFANENPVSQILIGEDLISRPARCLNRLLPEPTAHGASRPDPQCGKVLKALKADGHHVYQREVLLGR
jgi:hypothetical protein